MQVLDEKSACSVARGQLLIEAQTNVRVTSRQLCLWAPRNDRVTALMILQP
jgi:hypothetical protein